MNLMKHVKTLRTHTVMRVGDKTMEAGQNVPSTNATNMSAALQYDTDGDSSSETPPACDKLQRGMLWRRHKIVESLSGQDSFGSSVSSSFIMVHPVSEDDVMDFFGCQLLKNDEHSAPPTRRDGDSEGKAELQKLNSPWICGEHEGLPSCIGMRHVSTLRSGDGADRVSCFFQITIDTISKACTTDERLKDVVRALASSSRHGGHTLPRSSTF